MDKNTPGSIGPADHRAPTPPETGSWRGTGTVLFVDDDESVRNVGRRMLERAGLEVITAADGQEALDIYGECPDKISCVILDLSMPNMDGEETLRELRRVRGDAIVILSSGHTEHDLMQLCTEQQPTGFIQKPYKSACLIASIRAALGLD